MGFKEHIKTSQHDFVHAINIIKLLEMFDEEYERARWYDSSMDWPNVAFTMFSDSIAISYDYEEDNPYVNLYCLLLDLQLLQSTAISYGFTLRGAITIGQVFHDRQIIFGPAMIDAYLIEHEKAIYPRIIMQKETIDLLKEAPSNSRVKHKDLLTILYPTEDDFYYINYGCDLKVKVLIEANLAQFKNVNEHVYQKYLWMKNKYNQEIKKHVCDYMPEYQEGFLREHIIP